MKKKNIIIVGVLALGSYLFWRYRSSKKNFDGMHQSKFKQVPIKDNLSTFGMPKFGKPIYIEKK
jgi:hypothetical protein